MNWRVCLLNMIGSGQALAIIMRDTLLHHYPSRSHHNRGSLGVFLPCLSIFNASVQL